MQPNYPAAQQPSPPKKSNVGKIIGGCVGLVVLSCCCFSAIGGYVVYLNERSPYTPGDEISRVPLQMDSPQQVTAEFSGDGYAFVQIWADIDAQQTGTDLIMSGNVSCGEGSFPREVDIMVWGEHAAVADYERAGDHVTAKVMVHDEYMRAGESARTCTVTLHAEGGVISSGSLVVRTYQRPADRFSN